MDDWRFASDSSGVCGPRRDTCAEGLCMDYGDEEWVHSVRCEYRRLQRRVEQLERLGNRLRGALLRLKLHFSGGPKNQTVTQTDIDITEASDALNEARRILSGDTTGGGDG